MPVSCDIEDLAESAKCFNSGYGPFVLKAIRIRLLCAILNSETMDCDIDTLAAEAKCFVAGLSEGQLDAIETWLFCQLGSGGGIGVDYNLDGVVDPTADPDDTTKTWTYTNTVSGTFWVWKSNGVAWQQIV